jgi:hypothetical protein
VARARVQLPSGGYQCHGTLLGQTMCGVAEQWAGTNSSALVGSISSDGSYTILFYSCDPVARTFEVDAILLNPGGNQLSTDQQRLPQVYYIAALAWAGISLLWLGNKALHLRRHIPLHYALCAVPMARTVLAGLLLVEWTQLENLGAPARVRGPRRV